MKIPTIIKFNGWSASKQADLIAREAQGTRPEPNHPGLLIYPDRDLAIVYTLYPSGRFKEAEAMPLSDGLQVFKNKTQAAHAATQLNLN